MWNMLMSRPAVTDCWRTVSVASVTCSAGIIAGQLRQRWTRSVPTHDTIADLLAVDRQLELVVAVHVVHAAQDDDRAARRDVQQLELAVAVDVRAAGVLDGRAVGVLELLARPVGVLGLLDRERRACPRIPC